MKGSGRVRLAAALMVLALTGLLLWRGIGFFSVVSQARGPRPWDPGASAPQADALGMMLVDIHREETAQEFRVKSLGVYILAMDEQGEAYRAGLRSGDQILTLAGREVHSAAEVNGLLSQETEGRPVTVTLLRQGEAKAVLLPLDGTAGP